MTNSRRSRTSPTASMTVPSRSSSPTQTSTTHPKQTSAARPKQKLGVRSQPSVLVRKDVEVTCDNTRCSDDPRMGRSMETESDRCKQVVHLPKLYCLDVPLLVGQEVHVQVTTARNRRGSHSREYTHASAATVLALEQLRANRCNRTTIAN